VSIFTSGKNILFVVFILALPPLAQANIGDTLTELRQRYGSTNDFGGQLLFEVRLRDGQIYPARGSTDVENHFSVTVYFDGDHSAMEIFTHNSSDPDKSDMSQNEIDSFLAAASDGMTWTPLRVSNGKPTWIRSDKKIIAKFNANTSGAADGASVLIIMLNDQ
jgi:hypothetical protein